MARPTNRAALLVLLLAGVGCDQSTAEVIEEINAAREGCTQDELKAASEECVQMFETYAEMGTEAMQSYIGALKALDKAVGRMPESALDTTGLSDLFTLDPQDYADPKQGTLSDRFPRSPGGMEELGPTRPEAYYPPYSTYDDTLGYPLDYPPDYPPDYPLEPRSRPMFREVRPIAPGRGVLRPPAERLDRPWIRDEIPPRAYPGQYPDPNLPIDTLRAPARQRPIRPGW